MGRIRVFSSVSSETTHKKVVLSARQGFYSASKSLNMSIPYKYEKINEGAKKEFVILVNAIKIKKF